MNSPWPKQMRQKFASIESLVDFCFPDGSHLVCLNCKISRPCTKAEIVKYINDGYPFCKKCNCRVDLANPHIKKLEFE